MTAEGQETLSRAKWLLEALMEVVLNGSVTIEVLLLLQQFKPKFLEIIPKSVSAVNEEENRKGFANEEIERNLNKRIEEFQEFQAEKVKVISFIRMCDLIQPGETC